MRIVLKVSSNNEYCDGGCDFALVDLMPELAALALRSIDTLREEPRPGYRRDLLSGIPILRFDEYVSGAEPPVASHLFFGGPPVLP
jgi:hypothetical protein